MPEISSQRTQTSSGYLQNKHPISSLSPEFSKLRLLSAESCYNRSLSRTQTSKYNPATTSTNLSSYNNKFYTNGRNFDPIYKIGVSSNNNRFNYSISSSDRANSIQRLKDRTSVIIDHDNNLENTVYNTLTKKYSNMLQSKPPTYCGNRNIRSSISLTRPTTPQHKHNNTKFNLATNNDQLNTQLSKSSSFDHVFNNYSKKTDHNSKDINNFENNQLSSSSSSSYSDQRQKNDFNNSYTSSSSLARYVATSGVDIYEKYSPAHYIPKCDLSRSRSLSEATTATSSSIPTEFNKINNNNFNNLNISNGNISEQKRNHYNNDNSSSSNEQQIDNCPPLDDSITLRDLKISSNISAINSSAKDATENKVRTRPPPSPTPLRSWERDTSKSSISSNRNISNDNEPTYGRPYSTYSTQTSSSSEEKVDGLRGLRNIGNTCFMNSVIQCLSHTSELTNFLKTQTNVPTSTKDQQILNEFAKLIREMWSSNLHSVAPRELKNAFSSKHRMYSGYNQQDAQEFLRFFLDSLHCALNTGTKGQPLNIDDSLSDNKKADLTWEWYSKIENSMIKDLFVGQFKSTLTCTNCGNTSVTFDPFWDLSVPLPSSSRCKLDACFEYFIKEEVLDGDEMPTCSKCKTRRKSTKTFRIQRFPKYLVIHLKRFSETRWSKLTNIVEFPTRERGLNMSPCAANSSNAYYTLYAISNHMGSTAGGHYVALCKNPVSKQWHEFNDNEVCSIPESSLVSSSAYLLFYERAS